LGEIVMKDLWGSGEQRIVRFVMPMCYMPNCPRHAINIGTSLTKHTHDHHSAESISGMGFWEFLIAHIKFHPARDATIEDRMGKHQVHICSGDQCGFGAMTKNGVKRHSQTQKGGRASDL
jgi:hypothetical protein